MREPVYLGPPQSEFHTPTSDYTPVPKPIVADSGVVHCMSLACEQKGRCDPIGMTNSIPPSYIYPPDCSTGALVESPGFQAPTNGTSGTKNPVADLLGGMSTTTMLLLAGAAYFLFFRKGR